MYRVDIDQLIADEKFNLQFRGINQDSLVERFKDFALRYKKLMEIKQTLSPSLTQQVETFKEKLEQSLTNQKKCEDALHGYQLAKSLLRAGKDGKFHILDADFDVLEQQIGDNECNGLAKNDPKYHDFLIAKHKACISWDGKYASTVNKFEKQLNEETEIIKKLRGAIKGLQSQDKEPIEDVDGEAQFNAKIGEFKEDCDKYLLKPTSKYLSLYPDSKLMEVLLPYTHQNNFHKYDAIHNVEEFLKFEDAEKIFEAVNSNKIKFSTLKATPNE